MGDVMNQSNSAIYMFKFSSKCSKSNRNSYICFEEIYKILFVHWTKCHEKYKETGDISDRQAGELKFMIDATDMIAILAPIFMVNVGYLSDAWLIKLGKSDITLVSGSLPSPIYFNFLLHTVNFKLCKPNISKSFNRFLEIFFMSSLEENNITGVIPLDTDNIHENKIYEIKQEYTDNAEKMICNSDIIHILHRC